jgi:hypothetical protein
MRHANLHRVLLPRGNLYAAMQRKQAQCAVGHFGKDRMTPVTVPDVDEGATSDLSA